MPAYTKEQFENYKGDSEFLEVKYYSQFAAEKHRTYEEYLEFFNWFYHVEEEQ